VGWLFPNGANKDDTGSFINIDGKRHDVSLHCSISYHDFAGLARSNETSINASCAKVAKWAAPVFKSVDPGPGGGL
jgi:hypothetical protein